MEPRDLNRPATGISDLKPRTPSFSRTACDWRLPSGQDMVEFVLGGGIAARTLLPEPAAGQRFIAASASGVAGGRGAR